jgi:VCBS repeat protein/FG-GAP repeat protein
MRPALLRSIGVVLVAGITAMTLVSRARSECTDPVLLGTPLPFTTGPNAHFIAAGDFNGDGILDLAVTNGDSFNPGGVNASLAVLIGTGGRSYAGPVLYPVGHGARGVVARDFDGDGILDLAVSNLFSNTVSVLLGNGSAGVGNGTFSATVGYPVGAGPFELVAADFDGNGTIDLATCLNATGGVSVLPGLGNGTFGTAISLPLSYFATGIATGDFNGDGFPDLAVTQNGHGQVAVLLGTGLPILGSGSFSAPAYVAAGPAPFHIVVADFNEDGAQDLAVANTGSGGIGVMSGIGNGTFAAPSMLLSGNSSTVGAADFNHDGILDIVTGTVTGYNSGQVELFLGQGAGGVGNGTFAGATIYPSHGDVYQLITRDLDSDGSTDVLTAQGYGDDIALLPGTCAPDPRDPALTGVRDVPNDNGGRVFVTWTPSSLDAPGGPVNAYRVWRRIPPASSVVALRERIAAREIIAISHSGAQVVYWEALATLPAQRLAGYGYTAATTQDSMPHSNPYTAFFVSALTQDIDVFYSSAIDSGYSVDNVPPHTPGGFVGASEPTGFALQWDPDTDPDLDGYRVYRGGTADFVPSTASLVAATKDPGWVDPSGHGEWFYKLSAVDVHANESDFSLLTSISPLGVDPPAAVFELGGARPNPSAGGRLNIYFALERGAEARLDLVDLAGRRMFSRALTNWGPGHHVMTLGDANSLSPGVYFVRLYQGRRVLESRAVVTR